MSKITNNGLTQSDTGCCIAVLYPYGNSGCQNTGTPPVVSKHRMCSRNGE